MIERILVVDDDQSLREFLTITLGRDGFEVVAAASGAEALRAMTEAPADLALVDLKMPGMDGLETLRRLKELSETVAVVIVTAFATTETAIQALKEGAYDYLIKPFKVDELKLVVRKALEERRLRWENQRLRREVELRYTLGNMVGKSGKVQELFATISRLAESRATVLLTGESGTGKTLLAKTIHFNSSRKNGPFVGVNCAAIPNELMESELFGHVRGAFTGRHRQQAGPLRDGRRRDAPAGRDQRDVHAPPGEAPARAGGPRDPAGRRDEARAGGGPDRRGHEPGPGAGDGARRLPGGPVLPAQRHLGGPPVPPGAAGGHPAPGQPLPPEVHRAGGRARQDALARGPDVPRGVRVAREHPGAGERDRAGRHARDRARSSVRRACPSPCAGLARPTPSTWTSRRRGSTSTS